MGTSRTISLRPPPPLEAKKCLFSRLAQERQRDGVPLRLDFLDVKKAYFTGIPKRDVYMTLPHELGLASHLVAKQVRCVYGTRDAGAIWEDAYIEALESIGFRSGIGSPCCFWHPTRGISTVVHGDDITSLGCDNVLDWMRVELGKSFELEIRDRLGVGIEGSNGMRILNQAVEVKSDGLTYEADPRHVDLLLKSLGLTDANSVLTPGVKDIDPNYELEKTNESSELIKIDDAKFLDTARSQAANGNHTESVDASVSSQREIVNACLLIMVQHRPISLSMSQALSTVVLPFMMSFRTAKSTVHILASSCRLSVVFSMSPIGLIRTQAKEGM